MCNPALTIPNQSTSLRLPSQPFLQPAWQLMRTWLKWFYVWAAYKMERCIDRRRGQPGFGTIRAQWTFWKNQSMKFLLSLLGVVHEKIAASLNLTSMLPATSTVILDDMQQIGPTWRYLNCDDMTRQHLLLKLPHKSSKVTMYHD